MQWANMLELKSINFILKEGHRGKITVYLDRIHQYLCAVKFCEDTCSIKEVAHDQAHDHIDHVAHCPITHMPHPPRCPISIFSINHDTHLPTFPIAHVSKKMSSCQKDVKLLKRCQMSKSQTHGLWRRFTKIIN